MQKLKLAVLTFAFGVVSLLGVGAVAPAAALSVSGPVSQMAALKDDACAGLQQLDSSKTCKPGDSGGLDKLIKSVINILSYLVGIIAVIMVIIGGLKYVLASGDPSNITSAKNTLLYALIGLFVAALAQVLVRFVLDTAN